VNESHKLVTERHELLTGSEDAIVIGSHNLEIVDCGSSDQKTRDSDRI
jgi:hypothetical protein